jgi:hypothetical protein
MNHMLWSLISFSLFILVEAALPWVIIRVNIFNRPGRHWSGPEDSCDSHPQLQLCLQVLEQLGCREPSQSPGHASQGSSGWGNCKRELFKGPSIQLPWCPGQCVLPGYSCPVEV